MKRINIHNYEMFFLDFFEKDLSQSDISDLFDFLEKHPSLKTEFYEFENTKLNTESILYPSKEILKVEQDIELAIIAYLENDLVKVKQEEITKKIQDNSIYHNEYQNYLKTILPMETIVYEQKESLKRKKSFYPVYWFGVAASIILLFGLFWLLDSSENDLHKVDSKTIALVEITDNIKNTISNKETKVLATPILNVPESKPISFLIKKKMINGQIALTELSSKSASRLFFGNSDPLIIGRSKPILNSITVLNEKSGVQYLRVLTNIGKSIFRKKTKDLMKSNSNFLYLDFAEIAISGYNKLTNKEIRIDKVKDDSGKLLAFYLSSENQRLFRYKKK